MVARQMDCEMPGLRCRCEFVPNDTRSAVIALFPVVAAISRSLEASLRGRTADGQLQRRGCTADGRRHRPGQARN